MNANQNAHAVQIMCHFEFVSKTMIKTSSPHANLHTHSNSTTRLCHVNFKKIAARVAEASKTASQTYSRQRAT
jgi:hypothetical protein